MRAESAVEPTRSEDITVRCRRSPLVSTEVEMGDGAGVGTGVTPNGAGDTEIVALGAPPISAIARSSLRRWPSNTPSFSKS
jgi:hypothetical protein